MAWWGKALGGAFGFMIGGPLGALMGIAFGHNFDRGMDSLDDADWLSGGQDRVQAAFFTATFSVMGYIAKADGRVTRDEIQLAESVMSQQGPGGSQFGAALENLIPDPAIYKFETGTGWEIRPDGQAVVFDFN